MDLSSFQGLKAAIQPQQQNSADNDNGLDLERTYMALEVQDDMEGEAETLPFGEDDTSEDAFQPGDDEDGDEMMVDLPSLRELVTNASTGVAEATSSGYKSLARNFSKFCVENKFVKSSKDVFTSPAPKDAPVLIVAWLMHNCDANGLDGKPKGADVFVASYGHAQKMRAAMTFTYGRIAGLGESEMGAGLCARRLPRKSIDFGHRVVVHEHKYGRFARAKPPQAHARLLQLQEILEKLYHLNNRPEMAQLRNIERQSRKNTDINNWGGGGLRLLMHAVYTISFLCLLRVDEALHISVHDIEFNKDDLDHFTLTLPFRKTDQHGEIKPFVLYALPEQLAYLCPVRALSRWLDFSGITSGLLFPYVNNCDQIDPARPMRPDKFLEYFRHNLLDIGIDPYPYGTHSFRRGGCQYLAMYCRWSIRRICEWGGWSMELTNLTIVKYLISWNDDPTERREDFMNPNQPVTRRCPVCGRNCNCA
ncbi:DNA breaking-rejoining enzyme [Mycena kentingensis (nom. inval.)]|nr:DNA breaking-rejoining enzyme [Mycena kentingensis (nom. inval.)]